MIKEISECDRCGKDAKLTKGQKYIVNRINQLNIFTRQNARDIIFCRDCLKKFNKFMKGD